jgi:predicted nucleotidyltransferase
MTTFRNRVELLPEMVDRIVRRFDPEQIILFGSHARGDARPDSDVDLLVIMETDDPFEASVAVMSALRDLGVYKDIVVQTPDRVRAEANIMGTVERNALREGKVLYERSR